MLCLSSFSSAYLTVDNIPRCPDSHPYDGSKTGRNRCCGDKPITKRKDGSGQMGNWTCVDLTAPGRPSDCSANKHRCDDPLWRELMTEQCPKTCGKCGERAQHQQQQRAEGNAEGQEEAEEYEESCKNLICPF